MKRQLTWEKIFANHIYDKGLISKKYLKTQTTGKRTNRELPGGLVARIQNLHCCRPGSTRVREPRSHRSHGAVKRRKQNQNSMQSSSTPSSLPSPSSSETSGSQGLGNGGEGKQERKSGAFPLKWPHREPRREATAPTCQMSSEFRLSNPEGPLIILLYIYEVVAAKYM